MTSKKIGYVSYIIILIISTNVLIVSSIEPKTYIIPTESVNNTQIGLTMVTYNIRLGTVNEPNRFDNWENRKFVFSNYLSSLDADIIGLQEAYRFQIDFIIKHTTNRNYQFTGLGRDDGVHAGEHSAILFDTQKYKILDGETFWLSEPSTFPNRAWGNGNYRVVTWALFETLDTHRQFYVFNTHFDFSKEFHLNAVNLIHSKIAHITNDAPVFVMGDMNFRPDSEGYAAYVNSSQSKPLSDSFVVYHNGTDPFDFSISHFNASYIPSKAYRIDYIFISEKVDVKLCVIPKASYGTNQTYSDHYPVLLNCTI